MAQISNEIFETPICLIKRHKHRGRYELYIHDKAMRDLVKESSLLVVGEDLDDAKFLKKKMLFKRLGYGMLLAAILDKLQIMLESENSQAHDLQTWLNAFNVRTITSRASVKVEAFDSEEAYWTACYVASQSQLS